jgi:phytoene synthase
MQPQTIFRSGSTTFYYSSLIFPARIRDQVTTLYAFVRTADNYVDQIPQDKTGFLQFKHDFYQAIKGTPSGNPIIDDFVRLSDECHFNPTWTAGFLNSMEQDLHQSTYATLDDTIKYIYGSADVIGLQLSRIFNLPPQAEKAAQLLGRSFQYANFIRDLNEDLTFNRIYFPQTDLKKFNLKSLDHSYTKKHPQQFKDFMRLQISRYQDWQRQAENGFPYLTGRTHLAVTTASDLYKWTIDQIEKDPFVVYQKSVKPTKSLIFSTFLGNLLISN